MSIEKKPTPECYFVDVPPKLTFKHPESVTLVHYKRCGSVDDSAWHYYISTLSPFNKYK